MPLNVVPLMSVNVDPTIKLGESSQGRMIYIYIYIYIHIVMDKVSESL